MPPPPPKAEPTEPAGSSAPLGAAELNRPLSHDGDPTDGRGDIGVLLCHGFTGAPASMRPWADHLIGLGYSVRLPLLPGHGTRWQDANRTTFADWLAEVTRALAELTDRCRVVVICGLSMGGTLALRLAELHPESVAGLVLVNPSVMSLRKDQIALPVLKHLVGSFPGIVDDIAKPGQTEYGYPRLPLKAVDSLRQAWRVVRQDLARVTAPTLLLHSAVDHVVEPENTREILAKISSTDVTEVVLEHSYHVATLDHDAELIFTTSVAFIERVCAVGV